ncbi:hypothetical protein F2Q68_00038742 [Brassica cretica]|uniref:Uncharacterized protein n=1 Tax=Brassica cretica TaxID=69181 RepID=A0A8S9MQ48_BRACR|nr:hypothetical protein F2Q68_00038742 [Brassica cretica]
MSVWEGRESAEDENRGLWASDLGTSLLDVALKSTLTERRLGVVVVSSLPARQTRVISGCRCGEVAPELERFRVVALGGRSESIFRAPKCRKDERLISLAVSVGPCRSHRKETVGLVCTDGSCVLMERDDCGTLGGYVREMAGWRPSRLSLFTWVTWGWTGKHVDNKEGAYGWIVRQRSTEALRASIGELTRDLILGVIKSDLHFVWENVFWITQESSPRNYSKCWITQESYPGNYSQSMDPDFEVKKWEGLTERFLKLKEGGLQTEGLQGKIAEWMSWMFLACRTKLDGFSKAAGHVSRYQLVLGGYLRRLLSSSGTVARVVSIAVGNCLRGDLSGHGFQVRKGREIPREGGIRSRDTEIAVKGPVGSGSGSPRTEQWYALGLLVRTAVRSKPHTEKRISRWFAMYTWVSTVLQSANPCASHESGTIGLACTAGAVYWVCAWEQAMDCPVGSGWTTSSTGSVREREYVSGCKPYWRHTEGERLEEMAVRRTDWIEGCGADRVLTDPGEIRDWFWDAKHG